MLAAVQSGRISEARIDQSVTRILTLKSRLGLLQNAQVDASKAASSVGTPQQNATAAKTAADSITLVRNQTGTLPLAESSGAHVLVTGWGLGTTQTLATSIATRGVTTQRVYTGSNPNAATIAASVAAANASDDVVVTTNNAWGDAGQQALVQALLGTGKPVTVVSLAGPYDLAYFDSAPTYIAAYGFQAGTLNALVATLFGTQPRGHLPVTIHRADDASEILVPYGTGRSYPR